MSLDFLASTLFRALLIPAITVVVIIFVRWNIRRDDSTETLLELFAVGPDLLIAALLAVPAFMTDKAIALRDHGNSFDAQTRSAMENTLSGAGWWFLIVCLLAIMGFTVERKVKKTRADPQKKFKGWCVGVVLPMVIGAAAIAATFGLAR